jgi:DNA-directed RNA polymerase specialized sigma24 family protein
MIPRKQPDEERTHAPAWSPETETREEMKALLLLRRPLKSPEIVLFRLLYEDSIYDAYVDEVERTLVKWGVRGEHVTDLTQETFLRAWDSVVSEGPPDVLVAKLRGLAMGVALNLGTRGKRSPVTDRGPVSSGTEPPDASAGQLDEELDFKVVARKLFHALSREHQAVVDAVVFRDLTHEEAGLELGLPRSTVTTRFNAAIDRMRELAPELLSPSQRDLV